MKKIWIVFCLICLVSCQGWKPGTASQEDSTAVALRLLHEGQECLRSEQPDSALALWLQAADYSVSARDLTIEYEVCDHLARLYEQKNMFEMQSQYLKRMLLAAQKSEETGRVAYTYYIIGVSEFTQNNFGNAQTHLQRAFAMAPSDSSMLRARCQLMLGQVFLQTDDDAALGSALAQAEAENESITDDELFHLSRAYLLYYQNQPREAESYASACMATDGNYNKIELLRLLSAMHEEAGQTQTALAETRRMLILTDSVRMQEASATTARIHRLQHEGQMQLEAQKREALSRQLSSRTWIMGLSVLLAVAVGILIAMMQRRRLQRAREAEEEARRMAEEALSRETEVKAMNEDLQRRYYEHLYAIILPILNAQRTKNGHIDLNEEDWALIEENTNMVLPNFTDQLRRSCPSLTDEDVRFCCLVMMKVPNPVIGNIFGISPSSVSMRKQRTKKKMDDEMAMETLEACLSKYTV